VVPEPEEGMPSSFSPREGGFGWRTSPARIDPRADALQREWSADDARTFRQDLADVLNKHSKENGSNTADYILAQCLEDCLVAFDKAVRARDGEQERMRLALEAIAQHFSSDWPERCQSNVLAARHALRPQLDKWKMHDDIVAAEAAGRKMSDYAMVLEDDGDISLNWMPVKDSLLTMSISPTGRTNFAWLLPDGTHEHGLVDLKPGAFTILAMQRELLRAF